jgi:pilus assembly protein CpaB
MDKRLLTVVLAAILVALVITAIFYQITVGRRPVRAEADQKALVVAKADLPMGAMITAEDVRLIDYPVNAFPQGGFEAIEDVVDRSVTGQILANEPVISGRVTDKGAGFGLAPLIKQGYRAIAVAVNQVSGVSGFILPGSKVDVLLTARGVGGTTENLTTTVLENVTVLSTGHSQEADANGQPQNVPVVNMLLKPEDARLLTLATQEGRIQLVLRNPKDDEEQLAEDRQITSTADLFAGMVSKPAPVVYQRAPRPAPVAMAPAPPPVFEIEMIRGDKRSTETLESSGN